MYVQPPSTFDHSSGCYITSYLLAAMIIVNAIIPLIAKRSKDERIHNMRFVSCVGLLLNAPQALLTGIVHQNYMDEIDGVLYITVWNIAITSGILGFSAFFYTMFTLYFSYNAIIAQIHVIITLILVICSFVFYDAAIICLMCATVAFLIAFCVSNIMLMKIGLKVQSVFGIQCIGVLIVLIGCILQMAKVGRDWVFNSNSIYHTSLIVGMSIIMQLHMFKAGHKGQADLIKSIA